MDIKERKRYRTLVAYLYDPIPLDKVVLDNLKEAFGGVQSDPNSQYIFAESNDPKRRLQILTARLEFVHEDESGLGHNEGSSLKAILRALPPINVKGIGVTLFERATVNGEKDAGAYVSKHFLAGFDELQARLKSPIIASLHRFTYGEVASFFDVRISPQQIGGENLQLQLRKHGDTNLSDPDRIIKETLDVESAVRAESDRIVGLL